jgi:hypothetical protein
MALLFAASVYVYIRGKHIYLADDIHILEVNTYTSQTIYIDLSDDGAAVCGVRGIRYIHTSLRGIRYIHTSLRGIYVYTYLSERYSVYLYLMHTHTPQTMAQLFAASTSHMYIY